MLHSTVGFKSFLALYKFNSNRVDGTREDPGDGLQDVPGPGVAAAALVGQGDQGNHVSVVVFFSQEMGLEVRATGVVRPQSLAWRRGVNDFARESEV